MNEPKQAGSEVGGQSVAQCPGCKWVNRNHRYDCPVRVRYREERKLAEQSAGAAAPTIRACAGFNSEGLMKWQDVAAPVELPALDAVTSVGMPRRRFIQIAQREKWQKKWAKMDEEDCKREHYKHYEWELRGAVAELEQREEQLLSALSESAAKDAEIARLVYVLMGIRRLIGLRDHKEPDMQSCMVVPAELQNYLRASEAESATLREEAFNEGVEAAAKMLNAPDLPSFERDGFLIDRLQTVHDIRSLKRPIPKREGKETNVTTQEAGQKEA